MDDRACGNDTRPRAARGVLAAASKHSPPLLCTFVLHVLPNRGCHDGAGSEICCAYNSDGSCNYEAEGSCADGLAEYARDVVDVRVREDVVLVEAQRHGRPRRNLKSSQ